MSVQRQQGRLSSGGHGHKWWTLAAMCFGLFMVLIDVTIVNTALPTIQRDLHANFADLQWVVNAYTLTLAVFLVTAGRLGDIFGRRMLFALGLGIFTLGSLFCGLSGDISIGSLSHASLLNAARAFQGLGGAFLFPLSLAIISVSFQGKERGAAIGIWGAVGGLGTAIGPLVGGFLVEKVGWQWIFFINLPIGLLGIAITLWAVMESRDERAPRAIDFFGLITITVSVFALLLALIQGNDPDKGWTSTYILTLFAISAIMLVIFVVGELRLKNPMVDPRLFTNSSFTGAAVAGFSLSAGMFSLFFFLALYLQDTLGFSALDTGLRFLPLSLFSFITSPISGRLVDRVGAKTLVTSGLVLLTVAVLFFGRISPSDGPNDWVVLLPGMIIGGIGMGLVLPPLGTVAVSTVPRARAGMASGANSMVRQIGLAFGIAFLGAILTSRYNSYLHDKVIALKAPQLPAAARASIISGIQRAGDIAGATGLRGGPGTPNPYQNQPIFPMLQRIARDSFVDGLVDIFHIAAVILGIGALCSLVLLRKSDLYVEEAHAGPRPAQGASERQVEEIERSAFQPTA